MFHLYPTRQEATKRRAEIVGTGDYLSGSDLIEREWRFFGESMNEFSFQEVLKSVGTKRYG